MRLFCVFTGGRAELAKHKLHSSEDDQIFTHNEGKLSVVISNPFHSCVENHLTSGLI